MTSPLDILENSFSIRIAINCSRLTQALFSHFDSSCLKFPNNATSKKYNTASELRLYIHNFQGNRAVRDFMGTEQYSESLFTDCGTRAIKTQSV
jgi:hypothetical protein